MARELRPHVEEELEKLNDTLFRAIQSSHLNFLLGAGASCPGVITAGDIEADILALIKAGKTDEADKQTIDFLKQFSVPMLELLTDKMSENVHATLAQYIELIQALDRLLSERKTALLPKQATIFTTNYDLFIEKASEHCTSIILNDGFNRIPNLSGLYKFTPERLFDSTLHTGNHYDYTAELPSLNLIKLHGSMTWQKSDTDIIYRVMDFSRLAKLKDGDLKASATLLESVAIVLPTYRKFQQTLIERTYYDLLRIFSNVMEREGSLLVAFGFSFRDEHILEIVKRALRNPTLSLIISCYSLEDVEYLRGCFSSYNNVTLLVPAEKGDLTFSKVTKMISTVVPQKVTR